MTTITKLLAASAFALTMGVSSAQAAIFISTDGVTDLFANVAVDGFGDFMQSFSALTDAQRGGFESITVDGNTGIAPVVLGSRSVEFNAAGGPANPGITLYVTQTDLTLAQAAFFNSSFSFNARKQWSGNARAFVSATNQKYGGVAAGPLVNFAANSCTFSTCAQSADVGSGLIDVSGGLYSVTHYYQVSSNDQVGRGEIDALTSAMAVPEPGTWALMIGGFAGAGAMLRRRRSLAAAA